VQQDRTTRSAEIAYIVLILAAAALVGREASLLPPAPYDPLGPKAFPLWVSYGLAALGAAMLARLVLGKALGRAAQSMVTGLDGVAAHAASPWVAMLTLLLAFAYAAALSFRSVPFLPATAIYLFLACVTLGSLTRKRLIAAAVFAVVAAVTLDLLFRVLFQLDLR
jgi:hypothetical protein